MRCIVSVRKREVSCEVASDPASTEVGVRPGPELVYTLFFKPLAIVG